MVVVPLKLVDGLKSRLVPPTMTTMPLVVVALVMVSESPSRSVSLSSGAMVIGTSSGVVAVSSSATGGSLTGVTITVTVAEPVPPLPSLIVYGMVVVPTKLVDGVKSRLVPPTTTIVPLVVVAPVITKVSPSKSLSLASGAMVIGTSSGVVALSSVATGGSFTAVTLMLTTAVEQSPSPSHNR